MDELQFVLDKFIEKHPNVKPISIFRNDEGVYIFYDDSNSDRDDYDLFDVLIMVYIDSKEAFITTVAEGKINLSECECGEIKDGKIGEII